MIRRCHPDFSGYDGPWTPTPTLFAGAVYFKLLKSLPWTERKVCMLDFFLMVAMLLWCSPPG